MFSYIKGTAGISITGQGIDYIDDIDIINEITNPNNWSGDFIGTIPENMKRGSRYADIENGYVYEFDGVKLFRTQINTLNL